MTKVTHVKHARKAIPSIGIKKGDPYYWWSFRFGGKHQSATYPKPSQLTQSDFLSQYLTAQEELEVIDYSSKEDVAQALRDAAETIRGLGGEQADKLSNMPEGLQQGSTGELLQKRADACDTTADSLKAAADELDALQADATDEDALEDAGTVGDAPDASDDDNAWIDQAQTIVGEVDWSAG